MGVAAQSCQTTSRTNVNLMVSIGVWKLPSNRFRNKYLDMADRNDEWTTSLFSCISIEVGLPGIGINLNLPRADTYPPITYPSRCLKYITSRTGSAPLQRHWYGTATTLAWWVLVMITHLPSSFAEVRSVRRVSCAWVQYCTLVRERKVRLSQCPLT